MIKDVLAAHSLLRTNMSSPHNPDGRPPSVMPDYHLNELDPRAFEQIVQAIAQKEIANGVTPFGDGQDGGRVAIINGMMNYPSSTAPWDGYLVIQSKFRLHPTVEPKNAGDWLIAQLGKYLTKFLDAKRKLKRPESTLINCTSRRGEADAELRFVVK